MDALALRLPTAPRAYLHQIVRKGRVLGNDQPLGIGSSIASGTLVTVLPSRRLAELVEQAGLSPQALLYEDRHALVVTKPAGLAMHRATGIDDHLEGRVARFLEQRRELYRARPVHRLDIGTSGAVLFAKGRQAAGEYGRLLAAGQFGKSYLAVVTGSVPAAGELATPVPDNGKLKDSLTRFHRLAVAGPQVLLDLDLVTGRPHQARRQLADAGWPIVGDRRYGGQPWPGLDHPLLHCHRLRFPALDSGDVRTIDVSLPEYLRGILASFDLLPAETGTERKFQPVSE